MSMNSPKAKVTNGISHRTHDWDGRVVRGDRNTERERGGGGGRNTGREAERETGRKRSEKRNYRNKS